MFALVIAGKFFLDNKHYYISAVVLMLLAAVPFFAFYDMYFDFAIASIIP